MRSTLTPETLAAGYEFLRTTTPFKGWRLPHADEIEFRVTREKNEHGHYNRTARTNHHWLAISEANVGHTSNLLMWLAHEIIHLHQALKKLETKNAVHNADFHRRAKVVCRHHGWDPKLFA